MDARTNPAPPPAAKVDDIAPVLPKKGPSRRRQLFALLAGVVILAAVIFILYWLLVASHHVTTDDAYVQADVADITPKIGGSIVAAPVSDTYVVHKGEVLVQLDPADYQLALLQAQAALDTAQRKVKGEFADSAASAATTAARDADILHSRAQLQSAQGDLDRAQTDLTRRQALVSSGAVSGDELTAAKNRFDQAKAAVDMNRAAVAQAEASRTAAVGQQQASDVLVDGAGVENNPEVAAARAKVAQAQLDLDRATIRAPIDGVVAKNTTEVGQQVAAGAALMTVVPIQSAYINANFKEEQLRNVRLGQPVTLTSDLYGSGVKFHGRVVGIAGGTGSAFAIIPAQNATGNWIKVVQRLPVRIALDPNELAKHPLQVGLSMNVDIDTSSH
jgi:membrane fusion protein, multidrug efflux system